MSPRCQKTFQISTTPAVPRGFPLHHLYCLSAYEFAWAASVPSFRNTEKQPFQLGKTSHHTKQFVDLVRWPAARFRVSALFLSLPLSPWSSCCSATSLLLQWRKMSCGIQDCHLSVGPGQPQKRNSILSFQKKHLTGCLSRRPNLLSSIPTTSVTRCWPSFVSGDCSNWRWRIASSGGEICVQYFGYTYTKQIVFIWNSHLTGHLLFYLAVLKGRHERGH